MLRAIEILYRVRFLVFAILITLAIAFLSLLKVTVSVPISGVSFLDKIGHGVAYFTLTLAWLLALGKNTKKRKVIIVFCFFYGIIIEVLQDTITSYRTAEYLDALSNAIGIVLAVLIFYFFLKKKQSI